MKWYLVSVNGHRVFAPLTTQQAERLSAVRSITLAEQPADLAERLAELITGLVGSGGEAEGVGAHQGRVDRGRSSPSASPAGATNRSTPFSFGEPGRVQDPAPAGEASHV